MVYGSSALAVALDRGVKATAERSEYNTISSGGHTSRVEDADGFLAPVAASLKRFLLDYSISGVSVNISSEIPEASGLGSSAASAVACLSAVSQLFNINLSKRSLYEYSMIAERMVHGRPSGLDAFVSIHGGLVHMKKKSKKKIMSKSFRLLVSCSGIKRSTGEMVKKVSLFRENEPKSFKNLLRAINALVPDVLISINSGELAILAAAMNFNHEALRILGVSNEVLDDMVKRARQEGFIGAKLTGAGGGGCIIALPRSDGEEEFARYSKVYPDSFLCTVPGEGVKSWLTP